MVKWTMQKTLQIEKLSHDGRGIARIEGKTLFVEGALPGETVKADMVKSHKRYDEYKTHTIEKASEHRQPPNCQYYGTCGGCQLQHLNTEAQRQHKETAAIEQLQRSSGLSPTEVLPAIYGETLGYRSRARLSAWYHNRNKEYRIGFREANSKNILSIEHCPILSPELNKILPELPSLCKQLKLEKSLGHIDMQLHEPSPNTQQAAISLRVVKALTSEHRYSLKTLQINKIV